MVLADGSSTLAVAAQIMSTPTSSRIAGMKRRILSYAPSICSERARLITEAYGETEGLPQVKRRALAIKRILENMSIYVIEGELLAGNQASKPRAAPIFPEFSINWIRKEINGEPYSFDQRPGDRFEVSDEVRSELLEVLPYWEGKTHEDYVLNLLPDEVRRANAIGAFDSLWNSREGCGHIVPGFERVLEKGFDGLGNEVRALLANLDLSEYENIDKKTFYESLLIVVDAVVDFSRRYSDMLLKLAAQVEGSRKTEVLELARICGKVPREPAETFWEAIQSYWLTYLINHIESNAYSLNIGRFDQILYPYYKRDLEENRVTREGAFELVENFWLKVNQLNKVKCWDDTKTFTGYQMFTSLTVGGTDSRGGDAVNEISLMCLKAYRDLKLPMPSLCVRYFSGMKEDFLHECVETIKTGGGMPAIYNDGVAIPALLNRGVSVEDAYNWAIEGCVEITVPGKWGGRYGASFLNLPKVLEMALNGGRDPITGDRLFGADKDLSTLDSFDELLDHFKHQIERYVDLVTIADNINDLSWERNVPVPYLSLLVDDCVRRGKQIHEGGAVYDYTGGQLTGIAMVADCLAAIRKVVYEEKTVSGSELLQALHSNFETSNEKIDGEALRRVLIECPKYGNDIDYVDTLAKDVFTFYNSVVQRKRNTRFGRGPIGGRFHPSTATVVNNVPMGEMVGATPNGRKAFEPLSEGLSPFRGSDKSGVTAVMKTVSKMPNVLYSGGQLLNIKLNPLYFKGKEGTRIIADLLRTYYMLGGYHVQINFVDNKTLIDAKEHPERHQDLVVRVAGYSALFVHLHPQVQDDIINRMEHGH